MFIAPRDAKCSRPRCSFAGQDVFSQRQTASSSARCRCCRSAGTPSASPTAVRRRPPAQDRSDDPRDDVAGFLEITQSPSRMSLRAMSSALCSVAIEMVDPAMNDRLEHRERRHRAGAADIHLDALEQRRLLLRREFEGDGPARKLAGGAETRPQIDAIELDDDAVGVEVERAPLLFPFAAEREERVDARQRRQCGSTGQTPRAQLLKRFRVRRQADLGSRRPALGPPTT